MAKEDDLITETSREQKKLTEVVGGLYKLAHERLAGDDRIELRRREHIAFLERGLEYMGPGYAVLDSSRPWLCYWIFHSLALLGESIMPDVRNRCIDFLKRCQDSWGGYGGGPGQLPHLATTYAAVCALVTAGGKRALESIDRPKLLDFLLRMKAENGGFHMHEDGEIDVRGSYCAMAVAHMLSLTNQELTAGVGAYIATCQTYEGGIGGEPGVEAHGGYTFCGLAACMLAGQTHLLDLPRLLFWLVSRQGAVEGGFQGRINKLVDGCYSFWQGGTFLLLQRLVPQLSAQGGKKWRFRGGGEKQRGEDATPEGSKGPKGGERCGSLHEGGQQEGGFEAGHSGIECLENVEKKDRGGLVKVGTKETMESGKEETAGGENACKEELLVGDQGTATSARSLESEVRAVYSADFGRVRDADPSSEIGTESQEKQQTSHGHGSMRNGAEQASKVEDERSVESSEYETDEEDGGSFWPGIRTAAELFPCDDLEALEGCDCGRLVIEEEEGEGRPKASERGAKEASGSGRDEDEVRNEADERTPKASEIDASTGETEALGSGQTENEVGGEEQGFGEGGEGLGEPLFNARALQAYILLCCQQADGGLRDKPGKARDYYHTCYCLSGLAAAQRCHGESVEDLPQARHVLGPYSNLLEPADPICNVHLERYQEAMAYFAGGPST